ncbi:hypothetical protein [Pseudoduganella aquatica]|uniref:hypothetical protein n=1 Tax=Pseudoduganella aquatica TaxID=2660641 RepID=UPI001E506655|nr:hypothetical protein [Pseudoduganella aquatica]
MELINFLGWFMLNVCAPLLAPIILLPLLGAGRQHRGQVKLLIKWAIRDGQLYWPVIAMCAAACYEAASVFANKADARSPVLAWFAIGWHVLLIVASSVLVTVSTTDATLARPEQHENTLSPVVLISIAVSVITAVSYSLTHYLAG